MCEYFDLPMPQKGDTVVVGLSGGVDSTLTACLLKEKGCNVIGVTMSLWDNAFPFPKDKPMRDSCYGPSETTDIQECKNFCDSLQIEYHVIDVKNEYKKNVLEYFKSEYRAGRTPNPCIRCNQFVKFGALLDGIQNLGIEYKYFCTGHYARLVRPSVGLWNTDVKPVLVATAKDFSKDQSYFLSRLPSRTLEKVRFPLWGISKKDVFLQARARGLGAANRQESQDFIPPEYRDFLFSDKPSTPGDIIDLDGHILGKHKGIEYYTVGQRRGLGVSSKRALYVHSIDANNNVVVLSEQDALSAKGLLADDWVWPGEVEPNCAFDAMVKIRLASKPVAARVELVNSCPSTNSIPDATSNTFRARKIYKVTFKEEQRAVSPGQSVVVIIDGAIYGSGIIMNAF